MERVFPVKTTASFSPSPVGKRAVPGDVVSKSGNIVEIISSGVFMVALEDGQKVEVRGSKALKPGSRVQVYFRLEGRQNEKSISA